MCWEKKCINYYRPAEKMGVFFFFLFFPFVTLPPHSNLSLAGQILLEQLPPSPPVSRWPTPAMTSFFALPFDILLHIFRDLEVTDVIRVGMVSLRVHCFRVTISVDT